MKDYNFFILSIVFAISLYFGYKQMSGLKDKLVELQVNVTNINQKCDENERNIITCTNKQKSVRNSNSDKDISYQVKNLVPIPEVNHDNEQEDNDSKNSLNETYDEFLKKTDSSMEIENDIKKFPIVIVGEKDNEQFIDCKDKIFNTLSEQDYIIDETMKLINCKDDTCKLYINKKETDLIVLLDIEKLNNLLYSEITNFQNNMVTPDFPPKLTDENQGVIDDIQRELTGNSDDENLSKVDFKENDNIDINLDVVLEQSEENNELNEENDHQTDIDQDETLLENNDITPNVQDDSLLENNGEYSNIQNEVIDNNDENDNDDQEENLSDLNESLTKQDEEHNNYEEENNSVLESDSEELSYDKLNALTVKELRNLARIRSLPTNKNKEPLIQSILEA